MPDSNRITPNRWPTSPEIDWLALLRGMPDIADRTAQMAQARQVIMGRLLSRGTGLVFPNDSLNNWWWLMGNRAVNSAKLLLTVMEQPGWGEDVPRIAQGLLSLQSRGAWRTTTSNLLGSLALEKFARHYENDPVSGKIRVFLDSAKAASGKQFDRDLAKETDGIDRKSTRLNSSH